MSLSAGSRLHTRIVLHMVGRPDIARFVPVGGLLLGLQSSVACVEEDEEAAGEETAQSRHHQHRHLPAQDGVPAG